MKRIFLVISLLCVGFLFAQDSTQKLTAAKVYQDVKNGFQNLVEKLQGPAKHTYEIYVRQHIISGISYALAAILLLSVNVFILKKSWSKAVINKTGYMESEWNSWAIIRLIFSISSAVSLIIFCGIFFGTSFSEIVNPEYYAIQDIITALK